MKHLIIGIDGTWRAAFADVFHSNVYRLNLALARDDTKGHPQIFIYSSGVGSFGKAFRTWYGAIGDGIDELILEAYVNLVSNYAPGDRIYIFGFSRGAVAARALSGLISKSGLLKADSSHLIEQAWRFFLEEEMTISYFPSDDNVHKNVNIEFIGVWDTVFGRVPFKQLIEKPFPRLRFKSYALDSSVKHGIHLIAMDETRRAFTPMLWDDYRDDQVLEQIWIPGVHTDVGGGYQESLISTVSLIAMLDKLREHCPALRFEERYILGPLADSINKHDVHIHDERERFGTFGVRPRRVHLDLRKRNQSIHPLATFLEGKPIYFKARDATRAYTPLCRLPLQNTVLPVTKFRKNSFLRSLVDPLRGKFTNAEFYVGA